MAGIIDRTTKTIDVYDSAPSPPVHRDIRKLMTKHFPGFTVTHQHCHHQERGSEDCGLYMAATFMAHHWNINIKADNQLPKRLRELLGSEAPADTVQRCLRGTIEGGAPGTMTFLDIITNVSEVERAAARQNLCFMLCATAVAVMIDGKPRPFDMPALRQAAMEVGLRPRGTDPRKKNTQEDILDALAGMGLTYSLVEHDATTGELRLTSPVTPDPTTNKFIVVGPQVSGGAGLPHYLEYKRPHEDQTKIACFEAGVAFDGNFRSTTSGMERRADWGHYTFTVTRSKCHLAVYRAEPQPPKVRAILQRPKGETVPRPHLPIDPFLNNGEDGSTNPGAAEHEGARAWFDGEEHIFTEGRWVHYYPTGMSNKDVAVSL